MQTQHDDHSTSCALYNTQSYVSKTFLNLLAFLSNSTFLTLNLHITSEQTGAYRVEREWMSTHYNVTHETTMQVPSAQPQLVVKMLWKGLIITTSSYTIQNQWLSPEPLWLQKNAKTSLTIFDFQVLRVWPQDNHFCPVSFTKDNNNVAIL